MEFDYNYLSEIFREICLKNENYKTALQIARESSQQGRIWLIGGFIYRNLVRELYGTSINKIKDIDFIIENFSGEINLPSKTWTVNKSRFGCPKLTKTDRTLEIDLVPLNKVYSIEQRNLPPKIEHYLSGVPLNIQHIIYDTQKEVLSGDYGLISLKNKTIKVNNLRFAKYCAEKYSLSVNDLIEKKAKELGFDKEFV